jgi:hypothetical protein
VAAALGPSGGVKLIVHVHHSCIAAARLRQNGHDVVAASDDTRLAELADEDSSDTPQRKVVHWSAKTPRISIASSESGRLSANTTAEWL